MKKFLLLLPLFLLLFACTENKTPGKYEKLAKCMTEKGAIMYGASWCPHCKTQKETFGGDWQFIKYQECDKNSPGGDYELCKSKGVSSYPTWLIPGQPAISGSQTPAYLAESTGCNEFLPSDEKKSPSISVEAIPVQ